MSKRLVASAFGVGRALGAAVVIATIAVAFACAAEDLVNQATRAAMLKRPDGRIAHIESQYSDIFITKRGVELVLSFRLRGHNTEQSSVNLRDPDDLPYRYSQMMTVATAYADEPKKLLMFGLGGGAVSTYLGRFMPDAAVEVVEIDPKVIEAAKTYFGMQETSRHRYIAGDARVFLTRSHELYDLILVDAYLGDRVPFHLLTKEFYTLVKQRLTPGGAAAFNVHDGTKLYASTVKTLGEVFPTVDLYSTGQGEVIAVAGARSALDGAGLDARAVALQERYAFRFPLPSLVKLRMTDPKAQATGGVLLTDDFAPVDVYNETGNRRRRH